jgi:S1-C subfamily serine protease
LSRTGTYNGYGFAVPVDIVKKIVSDMIEYGDVQKAFFGAEVVDVDTEIAKKLGLIDLSGVVVSYIQREGAAEKIGLQKGDVILSINGEDINSRSGFEELISYFSPGDKINVKY